MTTDELQTALIAAFPPAPITSATIHTADARWNGYDERDELALLEGKAWDELSPEALERHPALLVHAGGELFRAVVPAYLRFLAEREDATILPFHVVSQLTRKDSTIDREIFDERVGPMTAEQRDVIRRVIAVLVEQPVLREVASVALRTW